MDIDTIPAGREMDALVAEEVMGWTRVSRLDWMGIPPGYAAARSVPPYSTDIAAAWRVVEKLRSDGWFVSVIVDPNGNRVCIEREGNLHDYTPGDTAPLAICRAARKAVRKPSPKLDET